MSDSISIAVQVNGPFVTKSGARAFAAELINDKRLFGMTGEERLSDPYLDPDSHKLITSILHAIAD